MILHDAELISIGVALSRVSRDSRSMRDASARAARLLRYESERVRRASSRLRALRLDAAAFRGGAEAGA